MTRLFASFYLFVAISLVLISSTLELIFPYENNEETKEILLIQEVLPLAATDKVLLKDRLSQMQVDLEFTIRPLSAINWSKNEIDALANNKVITLYDEDAKYLYASVGSSEFISITLPYERISAPYLFVYLLIFLVLLGLAMALWLWPLWRDLSYITSKVSGLGHDADNFTIAFKKRSIVQPIANRLNLLSERVHNLLRDQRELTGAVAHEFRTPIARLKFAIEMNPKPDSPAWAGIHADIDELEGLVQEMLDYTQYDAITPELSISEIPAKTLCQKLAEQHALTTDKALTVTGKNYIIRGDGHFVERAISNLLTNAIRHAASSVHIDIDSEEDRLVVAVHDDGEGVESTLAERIFEPFFRPDNSRVRYAGGAGLGLAIVKRIQSWHNGDAFVKKSHLGGACFVLTYPK